MTKIDLPPQPEPTCEVMLLHPIDHNSSADPGYTVGEVDDWYTGPNSGNEGGDLLYEYAVATAPDGRRWTRGYGWTHWLPVGHNR